MFYKKLMVAVLFTLFINEAFAGSCTWSGSSRVSARTSALGGAVKSYMDAGTAEVVKLSELQLENLLSAVRVGVSQAAISNEQVSTNIVKSNEATASSYVANDQAMSVVEETERYRSLGYNACGLPAKVKNIYSSFTSQKNQNSYKNIAARPGIIADPKDWFQTVKSGKEFSAQSLFSGDKQASEAYINLAMGAPDYYKKDTHPTPEGAIFLSDKMRRDARKSVALWTFEQISERNSKDGLKNSIDTALDAYVGKDGGEKWAASMAGSHPRGILLDTVRLEALNLIALVDEIKQQQTLEYNVAAYALTRHDNLLRAKNNSNAPIFISE